MEQDNSSISWKYLPWKKFQKKSFLLQCKIYKAKQNNNSKLVRRLQKLLISSKSIYYLTVRDACQNLARKGLFLSDEKKLFLTQQIQNEVRNKNFNPNEFSTGHEDFRKSSNLSLLQNKIIESVWKFVVSPTLIKDFITLNRKCLPKLNRNLVRKSSCEIHYRQKKLLGLVLNIDVTSIKFDRLLSSLWLPLSYKIKLCKVLKKCEAKLNNRPESLVRMLIDNLLHTIGDLTILPKEISKDIPVSYMNTIGLYQDIGLFYFLRKEQSSICFYDKVQDHLQFRGININLSKISLKEMPSAFIFFNRYIKPKKDKNILLFPNSIYWQNCKKHFIYILKQEQSSWYLKVKGLKSVLINWALNSKRYSKVGLKSRFFYLKKVLAKHNG